MRVKRGIWLTVNFREEVTHDRVVAHRIRRFETVQAKRAQLLEYRPLVLVDDAEQRVRNYFLYALALLNDGTPLLVDNVLHTLAFGDGLGGLGDLQIIVLGVYTRLHHRGFDLYGYILFAGHVLSLSCFIIFIFRWLRVESQL